MSNSLDPDQDRQSGSKPFAKVTCRRQNSSLAWKRLNVHKSGERFIYLLFIYFYFFLGGGGRVLSGWIFSVYPHLQPYLWRSSSEGSGETMHMHSLA